MKQYIMKLFFLLFLALFLVSCEADGIYIKENNVGRKSNFTIKRLKGQEAEHAYNLLKGKMHGLEKKARVGTGGMEIDFNDILEIIDTLGIKNYTFKIINHPEDNYKTFHNLVLTEKEDSLKVTMMKYGMKDDFIYEDVSFITNLEKIIASGFSNPCEEVVINKPGGGGGNPGNGSGSGSPGNGIGDGGFHGGDCMELNISLDCSCGRSYSSWGSYLGSMCGNGSNPGYTLTLVANYSFSGDACRMATSNPCVPSGGIGVIIDPKVVVEDCNTSKEDLKAMFPNIPDTKAELLASIINDKGKDFGINTKEKLQHFLAQAGHETGGFNTLNVTESLNYSTALLIPKTYNKFTMDTIANPTKLYAGFYTGNATKLANAAMCCKNGNGNEASGDGWKYRGRGILQLTWKENYQAFKTWYNNKYDPDLDFVGNPDLISSNDTLAILSGLWYYKTRVLDKITIDSTTTVDKVTKPINAKKAGIADRKQRYQTAQNLIDCR